MPMPSSLRNLKAAFLIGDLRNKIIFTLFIIAVYRLGDNIICPGIDFNAVQSLAAAANKGGVIAYLNLFSGGALTKMAVFGLGIMPYITSSIIIQLLMVVIPKFEQWREEGPSGQRKLTQVTRYMTIALAIMQSTGLAYAFHNGGGGLIGGAPLNVDLIPDFTVPRVLLIVITMTAGTVVVMWLAELITQRGVGQGMSVLIFTNVISGLPTQGDDLLKSAGAAKFGFLVALALFFLVAIVFVEQCQRRIPVTFAKRVVGRRMYGGQSTYIPMKLNTGGVVPIIFAASVLYFPILISNVFPSNTAWGKDVQSWISNHLAQPSNMIYVLLYGGLVLLFAFFYAGITFDPHQQSDVIRKQGGYIPGIRPGYPTERHLQNILNRVTFPGALFLMLVALLPSIVLAIWNIQNYPFAGTTLLIAVGVALETMKQVDSQLMLRNYEGFLR
ncbi:MAG TPA: preprotein translocase subunit SecY [Acidimicrobiales bacterium]|nr:preprotein translocase subunit SecY [Acidimicrobiales bacterium]